MAEREKPAGYARSEARNAEVRATLEPLEPGERPWPLLAAISLAVLLIVANVTSFVLADDRTAASSSLNAVLCLLLTAAAWGMWHQRAWAVLGFISLLAITAGTALLGLLVAANLAAVGLSLTVAAVSGTLFWKLIRVLGRIQAPPR